MAGQPESDEASRLEAALERIARTAKPAIASEVAARLDALIIELKMILSKAD